VRTPTILAALVLAAAVAVAGCGSAASPSPSETPSSSPSAATPESEVCTAIADLQSSVESIKDVRPVQDGVEGYKAAIEVVRTDLKAVREIAGDEIGDQVDALETAIADLESTLDSVGEAGLGEKLVEVGAGVAAVGTAMVDLRTEAKAAFTECAIDD
jgi:hypothetical protein